jgi:hypothetical protein
VSIQQKLVGYHLKQSIIVDRLISASPTAEGGRREMLVKGAAASVARSYRRSVGTSGRLLRMT